MSKKKEVEVVSVDNDSEPLTIRKTQFAEMFSRTGNAVSYNCVKVQELASAAAAAISSRYYRITESVAPALAAQGSLVVFHEVFTFYGDRVAYPQMLSRDPFIPKQFWKCEARALTFGLGDWLVLNRTVLEDGRTAYCAHPCGGPADTPHTTLEDFQYQLDIALSPYLLDSEHHALVRHLTIEPNENLPEYVCSEDWEPVE
jgi:hypothetical protein